MISARSVACVLLAFTIAALVTFEESRANYTELPYSAAFVDYKGNLAVFPFSGKDFVIALPAPLARITYATDGKSLYGFGQTGETRVGLLRVIFNPTRLTGVPATSGFRLVSGMAVSSGEKVAVVSGQYTDGPHSTCGVFELRLGDGQVEKKNRQSGM